jgi:hypothetical protein
MARILLRHLLPTFADELQTLLGVAGRAGLAAQVPSLELVDRCRCNDDFCGTFYTVTPPKGAWGPGHYTVALAEAEVGMINVDVLNDRIVEVEVLWRPEIRDALAGALP